MCGKRRNNQLRQVRFRRRRSSKARPVAGRTHNRIEHVRLRRAPESADPTTRCSRYIRSHRRPRCAIPCRAPRRADRRPRNQMLAPASSLRRESCSPPAPAGAATARFCALWWKASNPLDMEKKDVNKPSGVIEYYSSARLIRIHQIFIVLQPLCNIPTVPSGHQVALLTGRV